MALATRNLYLVLKARDEASRVIRGFGRELTRASSLARAEQLRNQAALHMDRAAYLRATGASQAMIDGQKYLAQKLRNQSAELERAHRAAIRFSNAMHQVSSTLITVGSALVITGAGIGAMMHSSIKVAQEYERQVRLTATQADIFTASLDQFAEVGLKVAKTIAVPFEEIQPALYNIFSSTDANLRQGAILLENFAKVAVAGQVAMEDAAKGTIPILNSFNIPLEQVNRILDIQFQLVRKGVGTYGEFSAIFGRVIPSATRAGQNFEMVAAQLAYLTRNGLTAAMAAASAARAMEAMTHPVAVKNMEKLGIKVRDAAGHFLPMETALRNLRDHIQHMPPSKRVEELVKIFKGAGGTIQARRLLDPLLLRPGELEELIGYLGDMKNATGAFGQAYDTMSKSVAAQTQLLSNKWKVLQETVGRIVTPAWLGMIIVLQKVLDKFNELSPGMKKWIVIAFGVAGALTLISGLMVIFIGVLAGAVAAVMTAGVGFFWLIGAVAAVVASVLALGAAFVVMWEKSEGFRNFVNNGKKSIVALWKEGFLPFAKGIKDAWDKYLAPPLDRLWRVIEEKVWPTINDLQQLIVSKVIPAIQEIAAVVKDTLARAFEFVGGIIDKYVIPALKWLQEFYQNHKAEIDQVVGAVVWFGKQLLKVAVIAGVILALAFTGGLIGALVATVGAFVAVGMAIAGIVKGVKWLIQWIGTNAPKAWDWLVEKTKSVWESIKTFFAGLWADISDFFVQAWNNIVTVFTTVMDYLKGLWHQFWSSSIGQLVAAVINFVIEVIRLGWTIIYGIWLWGSTFVKFLWETTWNFVKDIVVGTWAIITGFIKVSLDVIRANAKKWGEGIANFFKANWITIQAIFFTVWNKIKAYLLVAWAIIKQAATNVWNLIDKLIGDKVRSAWDIIQSVWTKIKDFFTSMKDWLFNAGSNMITGLIDGITSKVKALTDKVKEVTQKIKDFFPHSPAKRGPLSGAGSMIRAGANIMKQLKQGMDSVVVDATIGAGRAANYARASFLDTPETTRAVTNNITINTQELRPERQAAELGRALAGRS